MLKIKKYIIFADANRIAEAPVWGKVRRGCEDIIGKRLLRLFLTTCKSGKFSISVRNRAMVDAYGYDCIALCEQG